MASNSTLTVTSRSVAGERFTQAISAGRHLLFADRSLDLGGSDRGPGPYSYLLAALSA